MDTLAVKDMQRQGEGQLKPFFKLCYLKCQTSKMRLNSLIWTEFWALLLQANAMWLTVVYEAESCCRWLKVWVEFKPQIVGSAGQGQALHQCACVSPKKGSRSILTIVQLIKDIQVSVFFRFQNRKYRSWLYIFISRRLWNYIFLADFWAPFNLNTTRCFKYIAWMWYIKIYISGFSKNIKHFF